MSLGALFFLGLLVWAVVDTIKNIKHNKDNK